MCDIILAPPGGTVRRPMLFGKNSDRQRNEAQIVERIDRADHLPGAQLACTYISIPQALRTHSVLLCRPFWMWGAEMGANEFGVVMGNEAVYARIPARQEPALTGMDLLRLALERARTAAEAVEVTTSLLERFGQGGNCGHMAADFYDNAFMIADPHEAFVLETVGREWLVERVRGVRALSNAYSIGEHADRTSDGMTQLLRQLYLDERIPLRYAEAIAEPTRVHVGSAVGRRARATSLLTGGDGQLNVANFMGILRDHDPSGQKEAQWDPRQTLPYSLCVHAGSDERRSQTTGSMVSEVRAGVCVHWVTATSAPCISIFKPVLMGAPLPAHGSGPTDRFDARALWWRHERMHRTALLGHFPALIDGIRAEREEIEADFRLRIAAVTSGGDGSDCQQVVTECWKDAMALEDRWFERMGRTDGFDDTGYDDAWRSMSKIAGLEISQDRSIGDPRSGL